ncbi:TlpA disulfide reductase family protein [Oceanisphaera sp. IT1-181]|uniref:TlpA disulfide reductase family protein n=1 Tax=Oceanisphaera sp. IT1-181 TaxID=3081199 RepID=UPI0029C9C46C|nr:TlpA disulfide reductase family protein [Oceanisphaera sp. IT1-181]
MKKRNAGYVVILTLMALMTGCKEQPRLTLASGEQQDLSDYKGQWLVVNYFAEWCAPCLREMPLLNELAQEQITAKGPAVLAVSFDALSNQALQDLSARYQMIMPVAAKLEGDWPFESPRVLPTTLILDPKGKLVATHQGELKSEDIADWQDKYWAKK